MKKKKKQNKTKIKAKQKNCIVIKNKYVVNNMKF